MRLIAALHARGGPGLREKMLSGCASVASRGADIAILSLTRLLLKVRLPVITGADADWASQFAEMRLVFRRSRTLLTSILLACVRVVVAPTAGWCAEQLGQRPAGRRSEGWHLREA